MAAEFTRNPASVITAVVEMPVAADGPAAETALDAYAARLDRVPGVDGAAVTATAGNLARLTLNSVRQPCPGRPGHDPSA